MIESRDLLIIFSVARAGSVSAGATKLGVHQATVFRRLEELERRLGVRLFDRTKGKYQLTAPGEQLCKLAEHYQETLDGFQQGLLGGGVRPSGVVRVTTTDTFAGVQVTPILTRFHQQYPEIDVELIVSNQFLTVSKREADVALRPTQDVPEHVAGRVLSSVAFAVYGTRDYLDRHDPQTPLEEHAWVAPDESLSNTTVARWITRNIPDSRIHFRVNSFLSMVSMARAGAGIAALPCHIADVDPLLYRVCGTIPEMATRLWLITHPDLRQVPRVRAFLDFFPAALSEHFPLFEGKRPRVPGPDAGERRRTPSRRAADAQKASTMEKPKKRGPSVVPLK